MSAEVALVTGVGPGLGSALARRFARAGMSVTVAARHGEKLKSLVDELTRLGVRARNYDCDVVSEESVETLFSRVQKDFGVPRLVVYNAGAFLRKGILETTAEDFERCWKVGCLGGFYVGRAAARLMLGNPVGGAPGGTIIFTGATASLRGSAMFHNLAVGKFGLRALAQSMARELQPRGIHVAHVVIDGQIASERPGDRTNELGPDAVLDPADIAESYYQLYRQRRSAWTLELDLRPWAEKF
ncbi:MAG TPA: SDR family NAD(P)-dependent oxidoreductase [Burkholderiales bacterium]|nr:SDR family NAD(P)-dependent oxidoreductase [Burkholderiales bacterium]